MTSSDLVLIGSYDYRLVALSVLIAILTSHCALDLGARVTAARGKRRLGWLFGGSVAMGVGIWSMHYTGMLAFRLPIPVWYDWPTVLVSLLAAVFTSAVAMFFVSRPAMGSVRALIGSLFMGGGIAALHYIAMAAMRLQAMCHYSPAIVTLSVALAIAISLLSLWLTFIFRDAAFSRKLRKAASAALMGAAIAGMHYTGMAAATFVRSANAPDLTHAVTITSLGLASFGIACLMVLQIALLTSLVDRLHKQAEQLRALAARLQSVREEERTRVAREIHDELGQALTAIKIDFASLIGELRPNRDRESDKTRSILRLVDEAILSVRRIATELRPGLLDDLGLVAAVEWAAEEFQGRTGTQLRLDLPPDVLAVGREQATALFRILQETLTNIARHAGATRVDIRLGEQHENIVLEVRDDGRGFSEERLSDGRSLGILGMRERALLLGGTLTIGGGPGNGTVVRVVIPELPRSPDGG